MIFKGIKRALLVLFVTACVTPCSGFVLTSLEFRNEVSMIAQEFLPIVICSDFHSVGTKLQNLEQLKYFVENVLPENRMHLLIESKFFYGIDYRNVSAAAALEKINQDIQSFDYEWSFLVSPQVYEQTTWIAWELPLILLSIFQNEALPEFPNAPWYPESIKLTDEQRRFIRENVSVEFCDPRMRINYNESPLEDAQELNQYVTTKCYDALQLSPTKTKEKLSEYIESHFTNNAFEEVDEYLCKESFDIEVITSILNHVNNGNLRTKKIVVLEGDSHTLRLKKILPDLNFHPCSESGVLLGANTLTDSLAFTACVEMSKIIHGELYGISRRISTPNASPKISPHGSPTKQKASPTKQMPESVKRTKFNNQPSLIIPDIPNAGFDSIDAQSNTYHKVEFVTGSQSNAFYLDDFLTSDDRHPTLQIFGSELLLTPDCLILTPEFLMKK